jgi:hypothetical protein
MSAHTADSQQPLGNTTDAPMTEATVAAATVTEATETIESMTGEITETVAPMSSGCLTRRCLPACFHVRGFAFGLVASSYICWRR